MPFFFFYRTCIANAYRTTTLLDAETPHAPSALWGRSLRSMNYGGRMVWGKWKSVDRVLWDSSIDRIENHFFGA